MGARARIHQIIEPSRGRHDTLSRAFDITILGLIVLNIVALIFQTEASIYAAAPTLFDMVEWISVAVFSVEYLLRIWVCVEDARYARPVLGRLRYALTPMMLVDLMAVAPFFMVWLSMDMRFVRAFRLMRLFRLAKLGRYVGALELMGRALRGRLAELLITVSLILMLLVVAAGLMYYAEREAQPEAFASIPRAMWWAVATLTTVGYGDVYPITMVGRVLGAVIAILGVGLFALPAGIISGCFMEELQESKARKRHTDGQCPTCGQHMPEEHIHE
ncbi:MAG: ion transporter [Bradymonadia bacterium]